MKKLHFSLIFSLFLFGVSVLLPSAALAQSGDAAETISAFQVAAEIKEDRTLRVTETITYFFPAEKHGIFRYIPDRYSRNGGAYRLHIKLIDVKMDGEHVPYAIESRSPDLRIKIGDKNQTVVGEHVYAITYETDRAINDFDDHDELYWNVTGNGWDIPIASASVAIRAPEGFDAMSVPSACFTGTYGSTEASCEIKAQGNVAWFISDRSLEPQEGLTAVLSFPKGLLEEVTTMELVKRFLFDNGILALPFLVAIAMYVLWRRDGRDPKGKGTVVPQYEPPRGLTPMEMNGLKYQSAQPASVTASIIDLARRGYLRILYGEEKGLLGTSTTYSFEKLRDGNDDLLPHERTLFDGMGFDAGGSNVVTLDSLKKTYYQSVSSAKNSVMATLRTKGFFGRNPNNVRASWLSVAGLMGFCGVFSFVALHTEIVWVIALVISALIIAAFGWFMPKKTKEGAIALEEVEGFKWFLSVTEKDRLAFHNAPAVKPEMFHAFLPYAIAFGVEERWAEQFKGLNIPDPDYVSGYHGNMNALFFVHSLNSFESSMAKAFTPPSSAGSGGSGFSGGGSGGGFGGGGGGSW